MAFLAGCVGYHAKPLDSAEPIPVDTSKLYVDAATLPVPQLREHRFDPSDGLDATEVAMLAVANNPDLKLLRDDRRIQRAQAFVAGLLPNPQLSFGQDFPIHPAPDLVNALTAGIAQDLQAMLLHSVVAKGSHLDLRKVELDELWAEWQMIAQSRLLFDRVRADEALLADLRSLTPDEENLQLSVRSALRAGNISTDSAAGSLIAVADLHRQIAETAQRLNQEEHDLRLLLGLSENVELRLIDNPSASAGENGLPTDADIDRGLAALAQRRPDLLALRAGYGAQEQKLREAVLKQFPAISIGFNYATDTSNITTRGYNIGLSLPLFDRGRAAIGLETATRQRLFDEYQSRLAATRSDIDRIRIDLPEIARQQQEAERDASTLREARQDAQRAFAAGLLDWNAYLALSTSAVARQVESVQLALTLQEQKSALRTLLGSELAPETSESP
jgi:outer membrane protein, heavy metal efflux system